MNLVIKTGIVSKRNQGISMYLMKGLFHLSILILYKSTHLDLLSIHSKTAATSTCTPNLQNMLNQQVVYMADIHVVRWIMLCFIVCDTFTFISVFICGCTSIYILFCFCSYQLSNEKYYTIISVHFPAFRPNQDFSCQIYICNL